MHDVAQRCYDDLAAAMAAWKADADARLEQLVTEMRTIVTTAEARMLERVRGWKGDEPPVVEAQSATISKVEATSDDPKEKPTRMVPRDYIDNGEPIPAFLIKHKSGES